MRRHAVISCIVSLAVRSGRRMEVVIKELAEQLVIGKTVVFQNNF